MVLALTVLLHLANGKIDDLNQELGASKANIETAVHANETLTADIAECEKINHDNTEQLNSALENADRAEARLIVATQKLEKENAQIIATDQTCRTLNEPLPDSYLKQLCVSGGNCE